MAAGFLKASKGDGLLIRQVAGLHNVITCIPSPPLCSVGSEQVTGPACPPEEGTPQEGKCQELRLTGATLESVHPQ